MRFPLIPAKGLFKSQTAASIVILGQPDEERQRIDNAIIANKVLSFLIYGTTTAEVQGLNAFPKDQWPTNLPLLYFSYHVMVGLGTIFVAVMALAAFLLWRRSCMQTGGCFG
jgi:cytochrome bd ubiquinol oxidase subunit I